MRKYGPLLLAVLTLAACSGGGAHHSSGQTNPAETLPSRVKLTPQVVEFCNRASDLTNATAQVGVASKLPAVKAAMTAAVAAAGDAVNYPPPPGSGMGPVVQAIDSDLTSVNRWVQTEATQSDLDHNQQPPAVANRFQDLGPRFRTLQAWSGVNCPRTSGGDNH